VNRPGLCTLLLALAACKKPESAPPSDGPAREDAPTPRADRSLQDDEDAGWLLGTWKEDGKDIWLLFNPGEVAELAGKPVHVQRRGKLRVHGKYVAAIFADAELDFEASTDRRELASEDIRHVYRRGAPP
jgi:hypothetical protein